MENGGKAPSIAEGIEQLCLGEELTAVVASRLGWFSLSITSFCRWWEKLFEFDIRCYDKMEININEKVRLKLPQALSHDLQPCPRQQVSYIWIIFLLLSYHIHSSTLSLIFSNPLIYILSSHHIYSPTLSKAFSPPLIDILPLSLRCSPIHS